jgi:hypothetical protein
MTRTAVHPVQLAGFERARRSGQSAVVADNTHSCQSRAVIGRTRHGDAALGHHGGQVAVAEPVGDVPADTQLNHFDGEAASTVKRVAWGCTWHSGPQFAGRCWRGRPESRHSAGLSECCALVAGVSTGRLVSHQGPAVCLMRVVELHYARWNHPRPLSSSRVRRWQGSWPHSFPGSLTFE